MTTLRMEVGIRGRADSGSVFEFDREVVRIGRLPENDLVLAHDSVGDEHAVLEHHDGEAYLVDAGSQGGTWVNELRVARTTIGPADRVVVGPYTLSLIDGPVPPDAERAFLAAIEAAPAEDATRLVYSDWLEEQGRTEAAELLRAQIAIKELTPEDPRFKQLSRRIEALAPRMPLTWRRTVAQLPIENCDLRFELVCPQRWTGLQPTGEKGVRYCGACDRTVHHAPTVPQARRLALAGHCVAVDVERRLRRPDDLRFEERVMLAGRIA